MSRAGRLITQAARGASWRRAPGTMQATGSHCGVRMTKQALEATTGIEPEYTALQAPHFRLSRAVTCVSGAVICTQLRLDSLSWGHGWGHGFEVVRRSWSPIVHRCGVDPAGKVRQPADRRWPGRYLQNRRPHAASDPPYEPAPAQRVIPVSGSFMRSGFATRASIGRNSRACSMSVVISSPGSAKTS